MSKKIIVIDDDEDVSLLLSFRLNNEGYTVITASTGKKGLEKLADDSFSLILLDKNLPDINGLELAKTIKSDPKISNLPIIIISGFRKQPEDEIAEAFLLKPYEWNELSSLIKELISEKKS
ncbi:MAG: Alkaline phosphatase synthesis transcriptional regulatory protein PhoP [Chlamydiales bacterium]|nr:Alkaline phosphatase synthesis transcriptional regulatory protein PhoP [Chlamydiales bacterium]MCH9619828.1 Alkaline phosphatase synthesis transcriptional regulatory protein PhoP [Chlamydiales bacterium]MCH9622745.1 Alkaline phosphatase synthesis transcriptional regulatory protein PhoP [Chlamydiales bacterium]